MTETFIRTPGSPAGSLLPPETFSYAPLDRNLLDILPLANRHSLSVAAGRSALAKALDTVIKGSCTGRAWLPSLCCASLAPSFLRRGFSLRFYSIEYGLPRLSSGDIFLYIHFCGFPNRKTEHALDTLPPQKRPIVIEDCVHSLFTSGTGRYGDFVLYSFRKFLPVPDGALLLSRDEPDGTLEDPLEQFVNIKTLGLITGSANLLRRGEDILDADETVRSPSAMGSFLLDRLPWKHIPEFRRKNYISLAERIGAPPLDDHTVPLGLPLLVQRGKAELERRLRAAGFEPPLSWDSHPDAPSGGADRMVILPCDERITEQDVETMGRLCADFFRRHPASFFS
jgi:hypothetical protein